MKTKFIFATLVAILFFFFSCKKETSNTDTPGLPGNEVGSTFGGQYPGGSLTGKGGNILYQATAGDLAAFETAFYNSVSGQITGSGRPGACPAVSDHDAIMARIDLAGGNLCSGTMLCDVTYAWYVFETPIVANPSPTTYVASDFTIVDQNSNSYTASAVLSEAQSTLACNPIINACGHVFKCEVKFTNVPQSALTGPTTVNIYTHGPGTGGCGTFTTIGPKAVTTAIPNSYYLGTPARAFVVGDNGYILVFTDCSVNCQYLLFQCPTGGTFEYSTSPTSWPNAPITLGSNGGSVAVPSNTYYWRCTLNYSFGNSLQATGLVYVP